MKVDSKHAAVPAETVRKVARLARLSLGDEAVPALAAEMGAVLELVERMQAVNTDGVEPMAHPLGATQRLRADAVTEVDERERFQAIAPSVADSMYLVPRVVE